MAGGARCQGGPPTPWASSETMRPRSLEPGHTSRGLQHRQNQHQLVGFLGKTPVSFIGFPKEWGTRQRPRPLPPGANTFCHYSRRNNTEGFARVPPVRPARGPRTLGAAHPFYIVSGAGSFCSCRFVSRSSFTPSYHTCLPREPVTQEHTLSPRPQPRPSRGMAAHAEPGWGLGALQSDESRETGCVYDH